MTAKALASFEEHHKGDESVKNAVEEDLRLQERLHHLFQPPPGGTDSFEHVVLARIASRDGADLEDSVDRRDNVTPERSTAIATDIPRPRGTTRWMAAALITVAAGVVWLAIGLRLSDPVPHIEPYFQQRSLVSLYRESLANGFQPYYYCDDPARFGDTFQQRQRVRVELDETPADRNMVGLSYLGGLSRDTTAMLARVGGEAVIVFVDRKDFDNRSLFQDVESTDTGMYVHRSELGELVLYEVSPFATPQMIPYLATRPKH